MKLSFKKLMFATVLSALAIVPASAGTITFTGTCTDCSGTVTATLVLTDSGAVLSTADFVSFTYGGSNLLSSYTILDTDPGVTISGSIVGPFPSTETVSISNAGFFFTSTAGGEADGHWNTGTQNILQDFGTNGVYNAATSATPEPGTWAMLASALGGLTFFRRRIARS